MVLQEFREFAAADAHGAIGCGNKRSCGGDKDGPLVAVCDPQALPDKLAGEDFTPCGKCSFQFRSIELRGYPLGTFAGDVRKPFDLTLPTIRPGGLDGFMVVLLIAASELFESGVVVPAIEHTKRRWIDFGNGDVKMRSAFLHMTHHETRAVGTDTELAIDRL